MAQQSGSENVIDMLMAGNVTITDVANNSGILKEVGPEDIPAVLHAIDVLSEADDVYLKNVKEGTICAKKKR